jgi:hypothetical protein
MLKLCESGKTKSKTDAKKRCVYSKPLSCSLGKKYNKKTKKCRISCNKNQIRQQTMRKRCVQKCKKGSMRVGVRNRCQAPCSKGKTRSTTDAKKRCIKDNKKIA